MRFEWDEAKSRTNLAKHKISFGTAALVFDDPHASSSLERVVEGEQRWQTLGMIGGGVVVLVAHTWTEEDGGEVIRIISARKATSSERRVYEEACRSAG